MNLIITPAEVAANSFGGDANIADSFITESAILAAQRKYLLPVLGKSLWAAIEKGDCKQLIKDYLKPALSLYVKRLVLPSIAAQPGMMGIVSYGGQNFTGASVKSVAALSASIKKEADALMKICMEYVQATPENFPEYDRCENIKNSVSTEGGVVL